MKVKIRKKTVFIGKIYALKRGKKSPYSRQDFKNKNTWN
jgi:hypothetical protein